MACGMETWEWENEKLAVWEWGNEKLAVWECGMDPN